MPWLLKADVAAEKIVKALARKKKVFNFPWQLTLLINSPLDANGDRARLEGKAGNAKRIQNLARK